MMTMWAAAGVTETAFAAVLAAEGVLPMRQKGSRTEVDLDNLPLPDWYGKGTEHEAGDDFDWSGWFTEWSADEA